MRILMISAMAAVAGASLAQNVTVSGGTYSLKTLLAEVSKQTGGAYEAASSLRDYPVVVDVKDVSAKDLLERLAKVVDAQWEKKENSYLLSRGLGQVRAAEAAEAEMRAGWLKQAIDKYLQQHANDGDWSESAIADRMKKDRERNAQFANGIQGAEGNTTLTIFSSSSPGAASIILLEALRKLPQRVLASLKPEDRLVFSTNATRMQRSLPYAPGTIQDFVRAYNRIVEANKSNAQPANPGVNIVGPLSSKTATISGIGKVLIVASRRGEALQLSLMVVSQQGDVLDRANAFLGAPIAGAGTIPEGATGEIVLTPEQTAFAKLFGPSRAEGAQLRIGTFEFGGGSFTIAGGEPPATSLTADQARILGSPLENEPMNLFACEAMLQLAKQRKKNLVAQIPDASFVKLAQKLASGRLPVAELYKAAPIAGLAITETDSFLEVSASRRAQADRRQVNRQEFAKLVKGLGRGYATLVEVSRYATFMQAADSSNLDLVWLGVLSPQTSSRLDDGSLVYLKLYATLLADQRQRNRLMIPMIQATTAQRGLVEDILFGQAGGPQIFGDGEMVVASVTTGGEPPQRPGPRNRIPEIVRIEPTEAYPDGVPNIAAIAMTRRVNEAVYAIDEKGTGRFVSASELGFRNVNPSFAAEHGPQARYVQYQIADQATIQLGVQIGPQNRDAQLEDAAIRQGAQRVVYDQLPASFLAAVERAKQQARNMRTVDIGGGAPPPPPKLRQ